MLLRMKLRLGSAEPRSRGELCARDEFTGSDLGAVRRFHAQDLDAAIGADDGEAVGAHLDDLPELARDSLGVAGRQRFDVEDLQGLAIERRPRTGRRVAAADQRIDLAPRLAPVDAGIVSCAAALVRGERVILLDAWCLAGLHEVDG